MLEAASFYSSVITMMHGPTHIKCKIYSYPVMQTKILFSQQKRKWPSLPSSNNTFVFVDHTTHHTPPHSYRWPTRLLALVTQFRYQLLTVSPFNPLNAELNPIWHLLALLGAHHILHVSRLRVKGLCTQPLLPITNCFLNVRWQFKFSHLETTVSLLYLKPQSVPRCKHFSSR